MWQRREGSARVKDTFSQMSPRTATSQDWRVSRQELQVGDRLPVAGLWSWYQFYHLPSGPGLGQPPCPSSVELLPAFLPFLPLPPLNRLRQQDGTNLWLNSPKITRDLSKAVCVKLTGVCTLLSNALSSEAGPGPPLPASWLFQYQPSSTPLGLALILPGTPQRSRAQLPYPSAWQRGWDEDLTCSPPSHQSCPQAGSSMCQPVLLQLVRVQLAQWEGGEGKHGGEAKGLAKVVLPPRTECSRPYDATGPQMPPAAWNKLSRVPIISCPREDGQKVRGGKEEESLACQGRGRGRASPTLGTSVPCEPTADATSPPPLPPTTPYKSPPCRPSHGAAWQYAKQDKGHELGAQGSLLREDTRLHAQGQPGSNLHPYSVPEASAEALMMVGTMVPFPSRAHSDP